MAPVKCSTEIAASSSWVMRMTRVVLSDLVKCSPSCMVQLQPHGSSQLLEWIA